MIEDLLQARHMPAILEVALSSRSGGHSSHSGGRNLPELEMGGSGCQTIIFRRQPGGLKKSAPSGVQIHPACKPTGRKIIANFQPFRPARCSVRFVLA
jgi:hypothetical protein